MRILTNQVGYELSGPKTAVVETAAPLRAFRVLRAGTEECVASGTPVLVGPVAKWRDYVFHTLELSSVAEPGDYLIEVEAASGEKQRSEPFAVANSLLLERTLLDVMGYFDTSRCRGRFDERDHAVPFFGEREGTVDVHGGWYDAAGDTSKYLSHLSYANFFNPQQSPWAAYALIDTGERLASLPGRESYAKRLLDEAVYGADWLVRMQDPAGYFYMTVFDKWSKKLEERMICAYMTQQGIRLENYQSGYRQGAGVAIAALARVAHAGLSRDYPSARYLEVAVTAFDHLEEHNVSYLDDGKENIIDDYCALLAATELYVATNEQRFLTAAIRRAELLLARQSKDARFDGWFRADDGDRPFWHAAEAGLPALALLRLAEVSEASPVKERILAAVRRNMEFELAITAEVANPFQYARQYVRPLGGETKSSFFVPHQTETGYWWQGESARLGSLVAAAARYLTVSGDEALREPLLRYAHAQLDWTLGKNPFDACMLYGHGRNNINYEDEWPNRPGGISNGVTSGFDDEEDIDFVKQGLKGDQLWRWTEQWIPHASWYVQAIGELEALAVRRA